MNPFVLDEICSSIHHGVVHELDEPDESNHIPSCRDMTRDHQIHHEPPFAGIIAERAGLGSQKVNDE